MSERRCGTCVHFIDTKVLSPTRRVLSGITKKAGFDHGRDLINRRKRKRALTIGRCAAPVPFYFEDEESDFHPERFLQAMDGESCKCWRAADAATPEVEP